MGDIIEDLGGTGGFGTRTKSVRPKKKTLENQKPMKKDTMLSKVKKSPKKKSSTAVKVAAATAATAAAASYMKKKKKKKKK